jgi:hypothetical protein
MSLDGGSKSSADHLEHILPLPHLYRQNGQADTEHDPDRPGAAGKVLEEEQDLVAQSRKLVSGHLGAEVVCDLRNKQAHPV